jgi:hypothetical protein
VTADGRLIRTDSVAIGVWRRLTTVFATWRILVLAPFAPRMARQLSNDQLTPLTWASHWKIGLGLLGGLSDKQIDFLTVYAGLNAARSERIFRTTALILVTIPVAVTVALSEIFPEIWELVVFDQVEALVTILFMWSLVAGLMMAAAWRARDLSDLLLFEQARRRLDPDIPVVDE